MDVLQGVLEASPDAVVVVDESGEITRANRNVSALLGYDPADLTGRVVEDLLPPDDRAAHVGFRQAYMERPEPRPMGQGLDLYALHRDGTRVPVEISLGVIEHGGETRVVATIGSLARRVERERALQQKNERLAAFASIVSHDLRNPLNVAQGRVDLAMRDCDSPHLETAARAQARMQTLIDDLLTLAREGETTRELAPVELAVVVEECWQTCATGDATLAVETTRTIRADGSRLQQLLANLVRNAVEHGGETVAVTVGDLPDGFYLEDDGPGIPVDEREHVFEMGVTSSSDGTGFGLHIVQQVADAHGWTVAVTDGSTGGARFEVTGVEMAVESDPDE